MKSIQDKLQFGILQGAFSAAELLSAQAGKKVSHVKVGNITAKGEHIFDLASLTKSLATAVLYLQAAERGEIDPLSPVQNFFATRTLKKVPIARLLNHTSGLIDWHNFAKPFLGKKNIPFAKARQGMLKNILQQTKFVNPRAQKMATTIYSDLGYIVLGAILEKKYREPLNQIFESRVSKPLGIASNIFFESLIQKTPKHKKSEFIPSEICPLRDRILQGEVMDENAWVAGGVSGHAGLFGTALAIHKILVELRKAALGKKNKLGISRENFARFCAPDPARVLSQRSFTLGFDTPTQPGSQSGNFFSPFTIGHLGFSGTSFWWDLQNDIWIILLTNRCFPTRTNKKLSNLRPKIHDEVWQKSFKRKTQQNARRT